MMADKTAVMQHYSELIAQGFAIVQGHDPVTAEDFWAVYLEGGTVDLHKEDRSYLNVQIRM